MSWNKRYISIPPLRGIVIIRTSHFDLRVAEYATGVRSSERVTHPKKLCQITGKVSKCFNKQDISTQNMLCCKSVPVLPMLWHFNSLLGNFHYGGVTWASRCLILVATWQLVLNIVQANNTENIKIPHYWSYLKKVIIGFPHKRSAMPKAF